MDGQLESLANVGLVGVLDGVEGQALLVPLASDPLTETHLPGVAVTARDAGDATLLIAWLSFALIHAGPFRRFGE